jgi:hypothetical protein
MGQGDGGEVEPDYERRVYLDQVPIKYLPAKHFPRKPESPRDIVVDRGTHFQSNPDGGHESCS